MAIKYFDIPVYYYHRESLAVSTQSSSRIPIVLIHAFPVDHHVWDRAAQELVRQVPDLTVMAIDMPGAGVNPVPTKEQTGAAAEDGAYKQAMDRLASSIVHAVQSQGFEQAIYVGISMGGYAALAIERLYPESVAGIALCDTKADADRGAARANRLQVAQTAESKSTLEPVLHFAHPQENDSDFKKSAEFIDTFVGWINSQTPSGIAWRQRMAAGRRDENDTATQITVPVAVISGELDGSSNPEVMRPLAEKMAHADVVFTQIDDAGHFTSFEKPVEVATALKDLVLRVRQTTELESESEELLQRAEESHIRPLNIQQTLENVPLTGGRVDWRVDVRENLDEYKMRALIGDEHTQVMMVQGAQVALAKNGTSPSVITAHKRRIASLSGTYVAHALHAQTAKAFYYLGEVCDASTHRTTTYVALDIDALVDEASQEEHKENNELHEFIRRARAQFDWVPLRQAALYVTPNESQISVMATSLAQWHATHTHCSRCGAVVESIHGGWALRCTRTHDDAFGPYITFPKIEPSMIVRITDKDDRILLQHNAQWDDGVYSVCSGFVEVGENIEHSIHREVKEELGIDVAHIEYLGSQPWPVPASLMVAYSATAVNDAFSLDTREVQDARWFSRDEFMNAVALGKVQLPGASSIALSMIEQWYGAKLQ
ncbi:NAD(+) diphosphatase [Alloscardovia venturai]|uniref:NAD(+) diphosphatase n=1 Tax=Alloscardovia venturai TaxID=1769421 RepID=A0ABW2Y221_9BIFI